MSSGGLEEGGGGVLNIHVAYVIIMLVLMSCVTLCNNYDGLVHGVSV